MMIATSILVFMLVHGRVVCDELYPISVIEDIVQNQPEWSSDNFNEPLEDKSSDEPFLASNFLQNDKDQEDLIWIKTDIVDRYGFGKDDNKDLWKSQPNFKEAIGTPKFKETANKVKQFFLRNNDWAATKTNPKFRTKVSCLNLLYVTAARYLLVTDILYELSDKKLIACLKTVDKKIIIPDTGVCFPEPYGTASCTSDYDVGLVGKDAGILTEKFNNYFQAPTGFGKPSELVFDTNVYAFTLEFAMPFLFFKIPVEFVNGVVKNEQTINYKMQELASAYYKVYKYNTNFFNTMVDGAKKAMVAAPKSKGLLEEWLDTFNTLDATVPMKLGLNSVEALRTAHNNEYQILVKGMSDKGGYKADLLGDLAMALIYAAEAYHTRGAIRHVVGGTQMKVVDTSASLTTMDLWASMIENWGEANKEFSHCQTAALEECFLKMSKYMWRMFNAMRLVRDHIPAPNRPGLVHFGEQFADPEFAMKMWLDYKKEGKTAIPKHQGNVIQFLRQFHCDKAEIGQPLSATCIMKMNDKVNSYNVKLAALVTDEPVKQPWRI